jgi:hypothetical protein
MKVLRKTPRGVITPVSVSHVLRALARAKQPALFRFIQEGGEAVLPDGTRYRMAERPGGLPAPGWCTYCWADPCACLRDYTDDDIDPYTLGR